MWLWTKCEILHSGRSHTPLHYSHAANQLTQAPAAGKASSEQLCGQSWGGSCPVLPCFAQVRSSTPGQLWALLQPPRWPRLWGRAHWWKEMLEPAAAFQEIQPRARVSESLRGVWRAGADSLQSVGCVCSESWAQSQCHCQGSKGAHSNPTASPHSNHLSLISRDHQAQEWVLTLKIVFLYLQQQQVRFAVWV